MYRQFAMSFAFELTPRQWSRCTENRTSAFCEFQQHLFRDVIPNSLRTILFHRIQFLLRTWTNKRPLSYTKLLCKCGDDFSICHTFFSMSFLSQEMSVNIDINKILPVHVSGVSPNLLSRSVTSELQRCESWENVPL